MRRRFTIYSFLHTKYILDDIKKHLLISRNIFDIRNSISWYQEIEFLISRNQILDIKNHISWFLEVFLVSRNNEYFLVSRIRFLDIKKWIDIKKSNSWYQEFNFLKSRKNEYLLISRNRILSYQEIDSFFLPRNIHYFFVRKKDFLISKIRLLDIKNSITWYQEFDFLISRNIFRGTVLLFIKYFLIQ